MQNKQYKQIVEISNNLRQHPQNDLTQWNDSPFKWIKGLPSRRVGKIGEDIVREFLNINGFSVRSSGDTDSDLIVDGSRVEVKLSTLWTSGVYKFQQIRDQNYNLLFCIGISPSTVHAWVAKKSNIVWSELANQHGGKQGRDTWWISFEPPFSPHSWMHPQDGDISKICECLRKVL